MVREFVIIILICLAISLISFGLGWYAGHKWAVKATFDKIDKFLKDKYDK